MRKADRRLCGDAGRTLPALRRNGALPGVRPWYSCFADCAWRDAVQHRKLGVLSLQSYHGAASRAFPGDCHGPALSTEQLATWVGQFDSQFQGLGKFMSFLSYEHWIDKMSEEGRKIWEEGQ